MFSLSYSHQQKLKTNRLSPVGKSLSKVQLFRKSQSEQNKGINPFSNNILKKSCVRQQICDQVIQIKLHNDYSPRKQPKLFTSPLKNSPKDNPYSSVVEEHRKMQLIMLDSFRKSFNIEKKPILQLKPLSSQKLQRIKISFSKKSNNQFRSKSQLQQNAKNEQKALNQQKQPVQNRRKLIHSAIGSRSTTKIVKNLGITNEFFKTNLPSQSMLFS